MCFARPITTCSKSEFCTFYEVLVLTLSNKSPAPKKLAQAEKNTYASKPLDLLEIVIIMLRLVLKKNYKKIEVNLKF